MDTTSSTLHDGGGGTEASFSSKRDLYFASLTERQQQGFRVAEAQLKTTFDVEKTHGFIQWLLQRPPSLG